MAAEPGGARRPGAAAAREGHLGVGATVALPRQGEVVAVAACATPEGDHAPLPGGFPPRARRSVLQRAPVPLPRAGPRHAPAPPHGACALASRRQPFFQLPRRRLGDAVCHLSGPSGNPEGRRRAQRLSQGPGLRGAIRGRGVGRQLAGLAEEGSHLGRVCIPAPRGVRRRRGSRREVEGGNEQRPGSPREARDERVPARDLEPPWARRQPRHGRRRRPGKRDFEEIREPRRGIVERLRGHQGLLAVFEVDPRACRPRTGQGPGLRRAAPPVRAHLPEG
mmetsp:Transcript_106518/g.306247  ORF Transcript_106518/g.306247 Transcript_106518/m.306247 type:complete len:279 (+) Transcript_106518:625-1461(+)